MGIERCDRCERQVDTDYEEMYQLTSTYQPVEGMASMDVDEILCETCVDNEDLWDQVDHGNVAEIPGFEGTREQLTKLGE